MAPEADSYPLMVSPVSSLSRMSETKMNLTLRELAQCVAALSERRGYATPFLSFQLDTYRDTLRKRKQAFAISTQFLY